MPRRVAARQPPCRRRRERAISGQLGIRRGEEQLQEPLVDPGQALDVGDRHVLVGLMHGGADEAELDHRAVGLHEARVRGAAGWC